MRNSRFFISIETKTLDFTEFSFVVNFLKMSTEKPEVSIEPDRPPLVPSTRFTLALLVLFAFIVQYSQRVNLPIAVVCIINRTKTIDHRPLHDVTKQITDDISESTIPTSTIASNIIKKGGIFEEKQFYWTELQQQLLLGGYWGGYIFTQLPGMLKILLSSSYCNNILSDLVTKEGLKCEERKRK